MSRKPVFFSAGEASGDTSGARMLQEMRKLGFEGEAFAVGGARLEAAGAKIVANSSTWGVVSIAQALRVYPRIRRSIGPTKEAFIQSGAKLFVPIDFGFYNIRFANFAKHNSAKVLYFMPPGSWRKDRQGADLPALTDRIATPFKWSAELLNKMGANAEWVGHPVKQIAADFKEGERNLLALLPGSRLHEIELNLPAMARGVSILDTDGLTPTVVVAPTAGKERLCAIWAKHSKVAVEFTTEPSFSVLKRSRAAIVCSGTATLEAAVCRCPMAVIFHISPLMLLEYFLVRPKFKFVAMPSILLDRQVVPELLGPRGTPARIAEELGKLLRDSEERSRQLRDFDEIESLLGPANGITRAAEMAMEMLGSD